MKTQLTILIALFMLAGWQVYAQQNQVKLMDLTVIPDFYSGDEPIPGDSIDVTVTFKVNKSNLSAKAAYKFGTSQDNGNVLNALGIFKKENKLLPVMVLLISTVIILSYCSSAQTVYTVTDTTDFDPFLYLQNPNNPQIVGKLQWAVRQTNDTPGPCIIIFNIAGSGPHTIILNFRLPTIKNSVIIDGTSQNGYLYGHPQIIIDGQNMVFSCFYFLDFPNIMLKGIHIRNFMNVGVMFNSCNSYIATDNIITNIDNGISVTMTCGIRLLESQGIIKGNFIGTDSDILPNNGIEDYGIYIQNASNNIIGGTGVNEGNTIAWCGLRGINIFSSNFVKITGNRLFNNTVGIWLANANMNKMAPVITSFTGITVSGTSQPGNNIEVFGSTGNENANVYLTSVTADADGSWTTTVSNPNYDYVIATATDVQGNTSMFSVAKLKEIPLTQLQAQDCGATDVALDQPLYAIPVPGATGYEFLVENKSLNFSESIIRNNNELKLIQLNSLPQSDIEYNIVVRVLVNSVIGNFGDTCTITTEPDSARYLTNELYMKIFDDEDFDPLYDPANNKYTIFSTFNEIMEKFAVKKVAPAFPNSDSKILQKIYSIEISNYSEVDSLIIYCQQSFPFMEYIEKIPVYKTTVNDPQYTYQWHLPLINSENAWVIQADASDVVVAIIDNAVLIDHLDLINNININQGELNLIAYPNLDSNGDGYVSSAELINGCSCSDLTSAILYFSNNIDDDDNGYKDDIAGWDAAHNDNNPGPSPVSPATINDFQHGTHCAGIAGASTNNFIGIASIASNVRLIPVKTKLDFSTGGNLQSTAEGIYYAMQAGANIISMSFGGPGINDTYVNLMNVAHQKGIVLVASAGNDFTTTPSYPASSDHVISVGATNRYDNITVYSNYGDNIDIMAPGGDDGLLEDGIFSCFATSNSAYGYMIGTSQACPLVAGLCALMKSYAPSATPDEIETCLIENAQELNLAHGCNQQTNDFFVAGLLGDGRIDAVNALTCFMTVPYPEFSSDYTVVCPNQSVQFFNESTGPTVTGWYWEFEGGTPATSAEQNPVVIFSSTGTYDVTLTVSNVYGNNTKIKSDYIVVGIPYASIFYNTPTEACSGERSYVYAEFTGVGPWTLYYNQISGSTITPLSITATESPYPIEILIGDQPVTIELTGMESQFCTGTATGSITFNPIDCNIECNILSLGNFETLTNSSFNQFSNFCPETYTDAVSYLMTSVNAYEGLKYIKLYCAYKTCGKYVSGLYLPFDEPLLDGHTYQIEFYGLCQNPTYPLVRFYASETIPCQLPNDWNDCGTFTPNLLTNISIFSNQWTKYTANITNNTGSDLNYLVFYVAGYENWVSIDYLRVLKADLQQLDISSVISDNLPCIGETLNIAYTICLPENVTTNAEAIDLSVIIPQGFTILPTSEFLADGTYSISAGMLSHPCNFQLSLDLKVEESIITNTPLNIHLLISSSNSCIISDPSSVINEITIYEDILILNKSTEQEQFNPGDYIPYVIEVTNTSSNTTISNIVIEDLLDLSFDDATLNTADFIYSTSDRKLYTNPFFLLPNETKIFDYQAKLVTDILYCSEINNCAKVISANDVCELPVSCTSIGEAASGITATYSVSNVSCWGGNNGSINLTVTGGSGGYSFIWSTGATTEDISHLIAGTYSVRITDSNGCFIIENITITQPEQLLSAIISFPNHCCSGASGSIELNIIGGMTPYSFLWSNGATTEDIGYLASGNYIVTITDANGCPLIDNDFIHCHVSLVDKYNKTNVSCYGGNDGSVWIFEPTDGTPPYSYVWSNGPSTLGIYNLTAGNYSLTVTDADGCYAVLSVEIIQPLPLNINYTVSNSSCYGANNGSIDITTTGGTTPYAYLWSTGQTIEDITGLAAGTYSVTVTDAHSCTSVTSVIISDIGLVMDLGFTITNVKCYGNSTGAINLTVEGGTPGYTYQWSDGQTLEDLINISAGTYIVTVTDANTCTATGTATITQPASALSASVSTVPETCYGSATGAIYLTTSGGTPYYSYMWSDGQTSEDLTNISSGPYSVTITDANQCTLLKNANVGALITISYSSSVTNPTCYGSNNGIIKILNVYGGSMPYKFVCSNGASSPTNWPYNWYNFTNLQAGTYTVTITESQNSQYDCSTTATFTLTQPTQVTGTILSQTNVSCYGGNDGSVTVTGSGGTPPYQYKKPSGVYQSSGTFSGLTAGNYLISIKDSKPCYGSIMVTITQPAQLSLSLSGTNISCFGENDGSVVLTVNGGTAPYNYLWSNGYSTQNLANLGPAAYLVTVTDINGCTAIGNISISEPTQLTSTILGNNLMCYGVSSGSVNLSVAGGSPQYSFIWSNGAITEDLNNLAAGIYYVTISDANSCTATNNITINQPGEPIVSIVPTHITCYGIANGVADLKGTGGTPPYFYLWSTGSTTQDLTNLSAGNYSVTVTDANNCTVVSSISIINQYNITLTTTATGTTCPGDCDGSATVSATYGATPYSYLWSGTTPQTTAMATNLCAGNYIVTVTDALGITATATITIQSGTIFLTNPPPTYTINTSQTWTGTYTINNNIIINTGATLTLNTCTLKIAENCKITVQPKMPF